MSKTDLEKLKRELEKTLKERKIVYLDEYRLKKDREKNGFFK